MEAVLSTIRPHLQPITNHLPPPIRDTAISLLGDVCYKNILLDINPNPECTKLAISKGLGIGIIGASAIVKLPQLIKLLNSRSADGVSFLSYFLETAGYVISLAYNVRKGFPFSTYGENALIAAQNVAIAALILHLTGKTAGAAAFVAGLAAAGYALANEQVVNLGLMEKFMTGSIALSVASKLPQIWTVYQNGGTGQLSAFAVFNYLLGSLSRIFTTLQEVDDRTILSGFIAAFVLNAILAAQMVYYWKSPATAPHARELGKTPEKLAMGEETFGSSTSTQPRVKSPTTRRRG